MPSGRWCVTWRTKNWKTGESNPSTSLHRSRDQRRPVGLRWAGGWQKNRAPREAQGRQVKNCRSHVDRQRRAAFSFLFYFFVLSACACALKLRSLRFPISRLCRIAVFFDTNHHTAFPTFFHAFVLLHGLSIQIHVLLHFLSLASPSYACPFLRAAGTRITSLGVLEPCSNPLVSGRSLMSRRGIECGSACAFCAHDGGECT